MAKSHHDVGVAFGNLKHAIGSRMSSVSVQPVTPHMDDMQAHHNKVFYLLQTGISYRTAVARIVRNVHTKRNELWLTPRSYSQSTIKHKGHFLTGFRKSNSYDTETTTGNTDIYITPCVDDSMNRNDPGYARAAMHRINLDLPDIDKPRLREATRRGTIASCIDKAKRALTNLTHNIPLDHVDADTYYDLQATLGFLHSLTTNPDIDAVRAAVRGHIALNTLDTQGK